MEWGGGVMLTMRHTLGHADVYKDYFEISVHAWNAWQRLVQAVPDMTIGEFLALRMQGGRVDFPHNITVRSFGKASLEELQKELRGINTLIETCVRYG
jgi:hypothetical protein